MAREFEDRNGMIEKDGWVMEELVSGDDTYYDFHTYGLPYNYGHLDLQIVLPMDAEAAYEVFLHLVSDIESGLEFEENMVYPDYLNHHKIKFMKFQHGDREVLRIIFSDNKGVFPKEKGCHVNFIFQEDDFKFICAFRWKDGQLIQEA